MSMIGAQMSRVVPQPDNGLGQVVFESKNADAGSVQGEKFSARGFEAEKAGGQDAQKMPARKYQHVAFHCADAGQHAIGTDTDLRGHLAAGTTVPE